MVLGVMLCVLRGRRPATLYTDPFVHGFYVLGFTRVFCRSVCFPDDAGECEHVSTCGSLSLLSVSLLRSGCASGPWLMLRAIRW